MKGALFLIVCVIGAGIEWLGGYNFDQRNDVVAVNTFVILLCAVVAEGTFNANAWVK